MMNERDIFLEAVEIADPVQRAVYVAEACGSDAVLRTQVEELLKKHEQTSQFLETPAAVADSSFDQTIVAESSDGNTTDPARSSGEAEFRQYLQPATRPGWLGRLGHYEIEEILGRGAFGIVGKAFDEKLHRVVAIKLMNPEIAATSPPRKRFLREARTVAAVTHENIVGIYAVEEEPIPYLVMEYVPGQTLQERMDENGPLDVSEILRIGQQIASGLAAAHAVNLIHRDIKPSNILLSDGLHSRAKISDFGLARAVDDASLTSSGLIAGTPMYMAPEQARGENLDHRADLFSLGSVLYQMTSGRPPFRANNTVAVLKRVCEDTPRSLDDVIPGIPDWLQTIIFRLLEKAPEHRYQSALELADLLARCQRELEHDGKVTWVEGPMELAETTVIKAEKSTAATSRKTPFGWLAGGVIAMAAVVGYLMLGTGNNLSDPHLKNPSENTATGWHGWPADAPAPAIAPFNAEQAKQHQEAWAKYLGVPVEYKNSIGMRFRLIPPGEFIMGSTMEEIEETLKVIGENQKKREKLQSELLQHKVILTQPLYVGAAEVTQEQYEQMMGTNPSHFSPKGEGREAVANLQTAEHPVERVSWNEAAEFCTRLSRQEELKPFYLLLGETVTPLKGTGYRLPTEAEWESACRAGTTTRFWSGDQANDLPGAGWFIGNSDGRTHAVGELKANPYGLYDMHGNVWEWVQDSWDPASYWKSEENAATNPSGRFFDGSRRVIRGGYWFDHSSTCRSSYHKDWGPTVRSANLGFRVVLMVDAVKQQLADKAAASPGSEPTGWLGWPADAPPPAIAPFNAQQAKAHQEAWAKYLDVPVEYENSIGMKFRLIPPGEFMMGSTLEEIEAALKVAEKDESWQERINSEAPQHKVILTQPIYVGVTEVTQSQYEQVMGTNPSHFAATGEGKDAVANLKTSNHPVEMVSWNDAAEFCAKLSQQEKLKPFYFRSGETVTPLDGTGYRLPTEAEWDSACRAGTTTRFWSGNEDADLVPAGWFGSNSGSRTHAAGELRANPFGLSDVHGNVREWVQDSWGLAFYGESKGDSAIDPSSLFSDGAQRVFRGGGWYAVPFDCRSSNRNAIPPTHYFSHIGFRVVLPVDAVKE